LHEDDHDLYNVSRIKYGAFENNLGIDIASSSEEDENCLLVPAGLDR